ncbi:MAG TPA: GNAT family N-acetyltransferase [Anaerolineae bacterium]|nr:GNAT family N-acetyltransferase [Anaerolineae bacterium]
MTALRIVVFEERYWSEVGPLYAELQLGASSVAGAWWDVAGYVAEDGGFWVALWGETVVGYAGVAAVPGLIGVWEMVVGVAVGERLKGVGRALVGQCRAWVGRQGGQALSVGLNEPVGVGMEIFLTKVGFETEHDEVWLTHDLGGLPTVRWPAGVVGRRWDDEERVVAAFLAVYEASFGQWPWYQPYDEDEVVAGLDEPEDILFAVRGGEVVGMAWCQLNGKRGEIEPIGVVAAAEGLGIGRALTAEGLRWLAEAGAQRVDLGVWLTNKRAIGLYERLGFERSGGRRYWRLGIEL